MRGGAAVQEADRLPGYYPDAEEVPFIAVPIDKDEKGNDVYLHGRPGDFVTAVDKTTGRYLHGIAADGRRNARPEASIYMSRYFGLGEKGTSKDRFSYFAYKGSGGDKSAQNWPLTRDQIDERAELHKRMTPEVQAAIDAGHAREAAEHPAPPSGIDFFPEATERAAHFGQMPMDGMPSLPELPATRASSPPPVAGPAQQRQVRQAPQRQAPRAGPVAPPRSVPAPAPAKGWPFSFQRLFQR